MPDFTKESGSGGGTRTPDTRIMIPCAALIYNDSLVNDTPGSPQESLVLPDHVNPNSFDPENRKTWLRRPDRWVISYYCPERFAAFLEWIGCKEGTPPELPDHGVTDRQWRRMVKQGSAEYTYFARGDATGRIKIGRSKNPSYRVRQLKWDRDGKECATLLATVRGGSWERTYHQIFDQWRDEGEWFAPHPDILAEIDRLNSLGRASA